MHSTKLEIESALRKKEKEKSTCMTCECDVFTNTMFWVQGQAKGSWSAHMLLWVFLSILLLCSYLCLFDTIIELHATNEKNKKIKKCSMTFSLVSNMDFTCNKGIIKFLYFVYVVEAFITLNWEARYKYTSPFSSLLLVHMHLLYL